MRRPKKGKNVNITETSPPSGEKDRALGGSKEVRTEAPGDGRRSLAEKWQSPGEGGIQPLYFLRIIRAAIYSKIERGKKTIGAEIPSLFLQGWSSPREEAGGGRASRL